MDRELLIEIGSEELPASWLPGLTAQIGDASSRPSWPSSACRPTPRSRPSARRAGWPCGPRACPSGRPTSRSWSSGRRCRRPSRPTATTTGAGLGFARKQGVEPSALERVETPKGIYLAHRRQQRGKAAVDVLPGVLAAAAARSAVPEEDALGRAARRRQGRAAVRPPDPLDAVPLRRPGRAVRHPASGRGRQIRWCRTCAPAPSPTATASSPPAAAPGGPSRSRASTTTGGAWPRTS